MTDPRIQGVLRWERYLQGRLSPEGIVREHSQESSTDDVVWRVGFRDDTRARIHVIDGAARASESEFEAIADRAEQQDWVGKLKDVRPGGIRIRADGELEELGPEGAEAEYNR